MDTERKDRLPREGTARVEREAREREKEFDYWKRGFEKKAEGQAASDLLREQLRNNSSRLQELELRLLEACFHAHVYYHLGDKTYRHFVEHLSAFAASIKAQRTGLDTLERKIEAYPLIVSQVLRWGEMPFNAPPLEGGSRFGPEPADILALILAAYRKGLTKLEAAAPKLKADFGEVEGCLRYIDKGRRVMAERESGALNSLIFELTLIMRRWSQHLSLKIPPDTGAPRRREGRPYYNIVAAFVRATFPSLEHLGTRQIQDRLEALLEDHRIVYFPW